MLKVKIDTSNIKKRADKLKIKLKSFRKPLDDSGRYMIGETMKNIKKGQYPNGIKWPVLKDSTLFYKRKDGGKTWKKVASASKGTHKSPIKGGVRYSNSSKRMRDTSNLLGSIDFLKRAVKYVTVGTVVPYAKLQQKITKFMGTVPKNRKRIVSIFNTYKRKIIRESGFLKK